MLKTAMIASLLVLGLLKAVVVLGADQATTEELLTELDKPSESAPYPRISPSWITTSNFIKSSIKKLEDHKFSGEIYHLILGYSLRF